jgi:hypothetical protein
MVLMAVAVMLEDLAAAAAAEALTAQAAAAATLEGLVHIGLLVVAAVVPTTLELIKTVQKLQAAATDKLVLQSSRTRRKHKWLLM